MSTTIIAAPRVASTRSLLGAGAVATVLASAATPVVAAAGLAAGISLDIAGAPIPVPGFANLTAFFSADRPGPRRRPVPRRPAPAPRLRPHHRGAHRAVARAGRDRGRGPGHEGAPDADAPRRRRDRHSGRRPPARRLTARAEPGIFLPRVPGSASSVRRRARYRCSVALVVRASASP